MLAHLVAIARFHRQDQIGPRHQICRQRSDSVRVNAGRRCLDAGRPVMCRSAVGLLIRLLAQCTRDIDRKAGFALAANVRYDDQQRNIEVVGRMSAQGRSLHLPKRAERRRPAVCHCNSGNWKSGRWHGPRPELRSTTRGAVERHLRRSPACFDKCFARGDPNETNRPHATLFAFLAELGFSRRQ